MHFEFSAKCFEKDHGMIKKSINTKKRFLYWTPRILGMLAILFMMLFSLDCFDGDGKLGANLLCLLMHNIPALIILGVLIVAWKWELIGGILFLAASLTGMIFFNVFSGNWGALIVMTPFIITGILFILHHERYHRSVG
jgi:hypothetical protein